MLSQEDLFFLFTLRYTPLNPPEYSEQEKVPKLEDNQHSINLSLSSGIDTNYLLHVISLTPNFEPSKIRTICVDFMDGEPESPFAKKLAEHYGVPFECVIVDDPLANLPELIRVVKEPRWNLYQYYLYKAAKNDTGFLMTADGADESHLGYTFRYKKYLQNVSKCHTWRDKAKLYMQCHANDWVIDQESLFKQKFDWDLLLSYFKQFFYQQLFITNPVDELLPVVAADRNGKLRYDYFPNNNKLAKYVGIELFSPFLTREDFAESDKLSIQQKYDYKKNLGKLPLRAMINRWDDGKRGFGFDLLKYWQRKGFDRVHSTINKDSRVFDYISRDWYNRNLSNTTVPYINKYLQILALECYLELQEKEQGGIIEECNKEVNIPQ